MNPPSRPRRAPSFREIAFWPRSRKEGLPHCGQALSRGRCCLESWIEPGKPELVDPIIQNDDILGRQASLTLLPLLRKRGTWIPPFLDLLLDQRPGPGEGGKGPFALDGFRDFAERTGYVPDHFHGGVEVLIGLRFHEIDVQDRLVQVSVPQERRYSEILYPTVMIRSARSIRNYIVMLVNPVAKRLYAQSSEMTPFPIWV